MLIEYDSIKLGNESKRLRRAAKCSIESPRTLPLDAAVVEIVSVELARSRSRRRRFDESNEPKSNQVQVRLHCEPRVESVAEYTGENTSIYARGR